VSYSTAPGRHQRRGVLRRPLARRAPTRWNFIQTGHGEYFAVELNVTATRRCALAISSSPARPARACLPTWVLRGASLAPATNPWYIVMATGKPDAERCDLLLHGLVLTGELWMQNSKTTSS